MLDFHMKHEGEPPARLLAQVQAKMREHKLPPSMARTLAPLMETPEDLDGDLVADLIAIVRMFERAGAAPERAQELFEQAVANFVKQSEEQPAEESEDIAAWAPLNGKRRWSLVQEVLALYSGRDSKVRTLNHAPTGSVGDNRNARIAAMSDGLQARIDRSHKPTIGREFAGLSMGELAMQVVRASGQRPLNMRDLSAWPPIPPAIFPSCSKTRSTSP